MIEPLTKALIDSQNADGGWGSVSGNVSNCESTSLALIGLDSLEATPEVSTSLSRAERWLSLQQLHSGGWAMHAGDETGSWATPLALIALTGRPDHREAVTAGARWLAERRGQGAGWLTTILFRWFPETLATEVDPNLEGWAWHQGTSSWVEPTAYSLFALKKFRQAYPDSLEGLGERIAAGELMLYDRACYGGGWNYGNKRVLGETMPPFPDITALALLALQDRRDNDTGRDALEALQGMAKENGSGLSLSLTILCNRAWGRPVEALVDGLVRSYHRTGFLGETRSIGLALAALAGGKGKFSLS